MPAAFTVRNAVKTYADGHTALDGVSFEVGQGEFFALLGHNGAGKTTLISAAAGLLRLSSGDIWIDGRHVVREAHAARQRLGVVPQELVFDPFFTVRETLSIQSGYFGLRRNHDWIDQLLHHLDLADKADTNTRNLSGGMKRRLMVAQALVHRPAVIILDEPTAGVDVVLRQSLWHFIRLLNRQGSTVILTTHYLEEAEQHCHRIAVLKQGRLAALDTTAALLARSRSVRLHLRLNGSLPATLTPHLIGSGDCGEYTLRLDNHQQAAGILGYLKDQNIGIEHFHLPEANLEQIFIDLTADHPSHTS